MRSAILLVLFGLAAFGLAARGPSASEIHRAYAPDIPRTWDDEALAGFMLPLPDTAVTVRWPSADYYYGLPERVIYKSYPVYHPDREPDGYLDSLRRLAPVDLFDPAALTTEADWIRAGELVFDAPHFFLPPDHPFGAAGLAEMRVPTTRDGVFPFVRYVVTPEGLRLGTSACGNCHTRVLDDGTVIKGAQGNFNLDRMKVHALAGRMPEPVLRDIDREQFRAPWIDHPSQRVFDTLSTRGFIAAHGAVPDGVLLRQGTAYPFPAKIPDLRGIRHERYLDATGHMRHRGPGDLMRYAAFNENLDLLVRYDDFVPEFGKLAGPLPPADAFRPPYPPGGYDRFADAQLYALALYLYALEPVPSPHAIDEATRRRGERVFVEQGCVTCHPPPHFTNHRLTPALGFTPPKAQVEAEHVFDLSVETDPGLARFTRRSTGYYKVPSLRGLWYRGALLHDGSLTTLEELFDPARLREDFVPSGFRGAGVDRRAVPGHPFGLELPDADRAALIAFLQTL